MAPRLAEHRGQLSAPRPDIDLDPVVLNVGAGREDQAAARDKRREIFPPLVVALSIVRRALEPMVRPPHPRYVPAMSRRAACSSRP